MTVQIEPKRVRVNGLSDIRGIDLKTTFIYFVDGKGLSSITIDSTGARKAP